MKNALRCLVTFCVSVQLVIGQIDYVLSPIDLLGSTSTEKMNSIYESCENNYVHIDSTVNFILDGCTAPILVGMSAMRSSADPFDPNIVGKEEVDVDGPPYLMTFDEEGMYVIFCDPSFKTVAGCITVTSDVALIAGPSSQAIPTIGVWGILMLLLLLVIVSIIQLQNMARCTFGAKVEIVS